MLATPRPTRPPPLPRLYIRRRLHRRPRDAFSGRRPRRPPARDRLPRRSCICESSSGAAAIAFHATRAPRRSYRAPASRSSFRAPASVANLGVGRPLGTTCLGRPASATVRAGVDDGCRARKRAQFDPGSSGSWIVPSDIVPSDGISAPAVTAATRRERRSETRTQERAGSVAGPALSAESHMDRSGQPVPAACADAGAGRQSVRSRAARRLDVARGGNAARPPGGSFLAQRGRPPVHAWRVGWQARDPTPPRALRATQTVLGSGSWPICASRVMTSTISHSSSILPSRQRLTVRPVNSTSWSVTCRPRMVNRVAT